MKFERRRPPALRRSAQRVSFGEGSISASKTGSELDFPLIAWPESNTDVVRFAQITDIHINIHANAAEEVEQFASDLAEINRYSPRLTFVLATGDLTNVGQEVGQFDCYRKAVAHLNVPLFNVVGNHDVVGGFDAAGNYHAGRGDSNYPNHLGPLYYAFNAGNCHFVVLNSMNFDDVQKTWVLKELRTAPASSTRIAALHYLPDPAQMKWFAANGIKAVLSGHWQGAGWHALTGARFEYSAFSVWRDRSQSAGLSAGGSVKRPDQKRIDLQ